MNLTEYTLPIASLDWTTVYPNFQWLVPAESRPVLMTRFADLFLELPNDTVSFLSLEDGTLTPYTKTIAELEPTLIGDDNINELLYVPLIDSLNRNKQFLNANECYHFKYPTVLGGEYNLENVVRITVDERIAFCGDIQKQICDLPDGAQIVFDWDS